MPTTEGAAPVFSSASADDVRVTTSFSQDSQVIVNASTTTTIEELERLGREAVDEHSIALLKLAE